MTSAKDRAYANLLRTGALQIREQDRAVMDFIFSGEKRDASGAAKSITEAHELIHDYLEALKCIPGKEHDLMLFNLIHVAVTDMHIRLLEHLANVIDPPDVDSL